MTPYDKIRAALELLEWRVLEAERNNQPIVATRRQLDDALAALAELERAATEPVAWMWNDELGIPHASAGSKKPVWLESSASAEYIKQANLRPLYTALAEQERAAATPVAIVRGTVVEWVGAEPMAGTRLYTTPPPAQVAEMREPAEVTDEMCDRAYIRKWRGVPELIGHEPDDEDRQWSREWLEAWRSELGPTLGLVEIREPSDDECRAIWREAKANEGDGSKICAGRAMFDACRAVLWPKEGL